MILSSGFMPRHASASLHVFGLPVFFSRLRVFRHLRFFSCPLTSSHVFSRLLASSHIFSRLLASSRVFISLLDNNSASTMLIWNSAVLSANPETGVCQTSGPEIKKQMLETGSSCLVINLCAVKVLPLHDAGQSKALETNQCGWESP